MPLLGLLSSEAERQATIKDIAQGVGLSQEVVSRAVAEGRAKVSAEAERSTGGRPGRRGVGSPAGARSNRQVRCRRLSDQERQG